MNAMRRFPFWFICLVLVTSAAPVRAQDRLNVVASFSILGDFARNVGGERVGVGTLEAADANVHVYAPTPADAKKIADARQAAGLAPSPPARARPAVHSAGSKAAIVA